MVGMGPGSTRIYGEAGKQATGCKGGQDEFGRKRLPGVVRGVRQEILETILQMIHEGQTQQTGGWTIEMEGSSRIADSSKLGGIV